MLGLKRIFLPEYNYAKAGVMLLDLQPATQAQHELDFQDDDQQTEQKHHRLMQALYELNQRYGKCTLRLESAGKN